MHLLNTVDIWLLDIEKLSKISYDWENILSAEEVQRANRFYFEKDKQIFIMLHACKRLALSSYLEQPPEKIRFFFQEKGKPFLKDTLLTFNLSHTKEMAILAISTDVEIGVDIEKIKTNVNYLDIAKRFFHPDEYHHLTKIEDFQKQQQFFYLLWTAKEALLKATGEGIAAGLNHFSVQQDNTHPKILKHTYLNHITLSPLQTPENFIATLAITGKQKPILYRDIFILFNSHVQF